MVSKLHTVYTISGSWDYFAASFGDQKIASPEMADFPDQHTLLIIYLVYKMTI